MRRSGHTLIELVVSLAVLAILVTAMASAVTLASRAVPRVSPADVAAAAARDALDRLIAEVSYATHLTQPLTDGGRRIAFTLADRDGDGSPERVEYSWSGTPGDPLVRRYNGSAAVPVVPHVRAFTLAPQTRSSIETYPGPAVMEASDRIVSSHMQAPAAAGVHEVRSWAWIGQRFAVQAPPRAVGWKPTEVSIKAGDDGALLDLPTDTTELRIHNVDGSGLPINLDSPLAKGPLHELLLGSSLVYRPVPMSMTSSGLLPVDQPHALVVAWTGLLGVALRVQYENSTAGGSTGLLRSNSGAWSWSIDAQRGLLYEIKGRFWVRQPDQQIRRTYVTSVAVTLAHGEEGTPPIHAVAAMPNMPEALSAFWRNDFASDPATLDSNGDGAGDWHVRTGATLSLTNLLGGLLQWQGTLASRPEHNLDQPVMLEARLRSVGSTDTEIQLNADAAGGSAATLTLKLRRVYGGQTLELHRRTGLLSSELLGSVTGLPDDYIRVRLVIDPRRDTVNLAVNGSRVETYACTPVAVSLGAGDRSVTLVSNSDSRWDWIEIRVGGESL